MECDDPMKALKCRIIATVDGKEVVSKLYTPAPVNDGCGQCGRGQCDSLLSHTAILLQLILDERILHHLSTILRPAVVSAPTVHVSIHYMFLPYRSLSVQHQCVATPLLMTPPILVCTHTPIAVEQSNYFMYQLLILHIIILCSTIEMQLLVVTCITLG